MAEEVKPLTAGITDADIAYAISLLPAVKRIHLEKTLADQEATITALREREKKLRERLRAHAITQEYLGYQSSGDGDSDPVIGFACHECEETWRESDDEHHSPTCILVTEGGEG